MKTLSMTIEEGQYKTIDMYAKEYNVSKSEIVRNCIDEYFKPVIVEPKEEDTFSDLINRLFALLFGKK